MQVNRGIAKIVFILSAILILTAIGGAILIFNNEDVEIVDIETIKNSLIIDDRAGGILPENISISISNDSFLRGRVVDSRDGIERDFYSMKIGDVWRIVEITNSVVSCERFARLGFPDAFISDCRLSFSDAVSVDEIDATLDDLFLSSVELKIIGVVESIENTENGQIVTVSSGGSTTQISITDAKLNTQIGDLIVTTITAPKEYVYTPQSNSTNVVFNTEEVTIVNEEDRDLNIEDEEETHEQVNVKVNPNTNSVYKIDAPKTSAPPSYFFNAYDVDNSFVNVELDGSF